MSNAISESASTRASESANEQAVDSVQQLKRCWECKELITDTDCQPLKRCRLPLRPRSHNKLIKTGEPNAFYHDIWLHHNCEQQVYAAYESAGWHRDDLDLHFCMGDSGEVEREQQRAADERPHRMVADEISLFEIQGNCVVFAWSQVVGFEAALKHLKAAPPMQWDGSSYVRNLSDWAQLCCGKYSISHPVDVLPVGVFCPLPFFAI